MGWIELHRKPGEDDKAFFANELGPGSVSYTHLTLPTNSLV